MNTSILVMSCDLYQDTWHPFFQLKNKYWKDCPYETFICTETLDCEYATTIKTKGSWTERLRKVLEQIDSKYVILLLDDFFIHSKVNQDKIGEALKLFDDNTACVNFEIDYKNKGNGFRLRKNKEPYLNSCQPSIHDRLKLIERLQKPKTAWEWELSIVDSPYKFYINTEELVFDIGYYEERKPWGIVQGKMSNETKELFKREGISMKNNILLSIIIPYYETKELTKTLLDTLKPQLNDNVEVLLINDGSNTVGLENYPITIISQANGGVSKARNTGLDNYKGDFVTFIDSDDNIKPNYIEKILDKINKEQFDYCFFSWEATGKLQGKYIIKDNPPNWNTSIWNCIYKKEIINNIRFNEDKKIGEDTEFNLKARKGKKANIEEVLYIYNSGRKGSLTNKFSKGEISINEDVKTQVVVYRSFLSKIGGIESAIYNLSLSLGISIYDMVFVYDAIGQGNMQQLHRLKKLVKCVKYTGQNIKCNVFIYYGVNPQTIESTLEAKKVVQQICNDMLAYPSGYVPSKKTTDFYADSESSAKSFEKKYKIPCGVLHNLFNVRPNKCLLLCSASRLSWEKGYDRMKAMSKRMHDKGIPFLWTVFTNDLPNEEIDGFIFMKPRLNVIDYMAKMDYVLQLSDFESWGCTITESLECGVPVICTDFPSAYEQVEDGVNGFILQRDLKNLDAVIDNMYNKNLKGFKYDPKYSIKEWTDAIGKLEKPKLDYKYNPNEFIGFEVEVLKPSYYKDEQQQCVKGDLLTIGSEDRLNYLEKLGYVKRIGEIL